MDGQKKPEFEEGWIVDRGCWNKDVFFFGVGLGGGCMYSTTFANVGSV